ncbi:hypothetical protein CsSME_00004533 [Camellia sinensis var. sinensis]
MEEPAAPPPPLSLSMYICTQIFLYSYYWICWRRRSTFGCCVGGAEARRDLGGKFLLGSDLAGYWCIS